MDTSTIVASLKYTKDYWIIVLPAIMAAADIITGFFQAQVNGTKNSSVMRKGLYRKLAEIGVILLAYVICVAIGMGNTIPTCTSLYVVLMEIQSIFENLQSMGVPIPAFITTKAKEISDEIDKGNVK